jgi:hypothetical protein
MWDLLFRSVVLRLIILLCVILLFPFVLVAMTPILLLWAAIVARRRRTFRAAVADVYAGVWDTFCEIIGAPFGHGFR